MLKTLLFPALLSIAIFTAPPKGTRWVGNANNGPEKNKISFVVSPDGQQLLALTFNGIWQGRDQLAPATGLATNALRIANGKVSGVLLASPTSRPRRFELLGDFARAATAATTFRMNLTEPGGTTRELCWTATPLR
ncbi:hypothetical protein E4631_13945 [Hymenobacter sp. UV11]|uniref:hypothetical protein n=1 Tax=Hymenobacter sp. UV11 TaxID=1849735 RepID=UPI0010616F4D|nr:hypothetical protein [Hymenobacter sp. UV11]TDN36675.1 hypothetical protein A8B98_08310 [Hymenobacter sp. UV11]TFZ66179.1 hypothetical protein E4631_13945 [Hymenobacter sp. UV11]